MENNPSQQPEPNPLQPETVPPSSQPPSEAPPTQPQPYAPQVTPEQAPTAQAVAAAATPSPHSGRFKEVKSLVIKVLIGCLIAAAGLAVVAVLVGELSEILWRALATLGLVAVHAIAALTYISTTDVQQDEKEALSFFSNAVFVVIVLSFITSVFGTWEVLNGSVVGKLYETYFVLLFAALHGNMLYQVMGKTSTIDTIVRVNFVFMIAVILMLMPIIYIGTDGFSNFYYRALSALGIIDATLTIVAVAMDRLYLNKHPKEASVLFSNAGTGAINQAGSAPQPARRHMHPILLLFGLYLFFQIAASLYFVVAGNVVGKF